MDLGNPLEVIMHYLLIGGMVSLGHQDGFPMRSALACMVTHWIGPRMKILVITDISVIRFYGYIGYIGDIFGYIGDI